MHGMFLWVKFHRKTTKDLKSFVLQFLRWSTFALLGSQNNNYFSLKMVQLSFWVKIIVATRPLCSVFQKRHITAVGFDHVIQQSTEAK